jgi:pyruvate/2-oxoacid:ferredoxin oxidoreductase alpha subunit
MMNSRATAKIPRCGNEVDGAPGEEVQTAKQYIPKPVVEHMDGAKVGIIAFGSTDPAVEEARDRLVEAGLPTDYLRLRAIPFNQEVDQFLPSMSDLCGRNQP